MAGPDRIVRFGPAILAGTLTGGVSLTIGSVVGMLRIADHPVDLVEMILSVLWLLVLFTLIAFLLVVPAAVVVGLPLSWLLNRFNLESRTVYTTAGAFTGTGVLALVAFWTGMPPFSTYYFGFIALGALSGAVSGWTWGSSKGTTAPPAD